MRDESSVAVSGEIEKNARTERNRARFCRLDGYEAVPIKIRSD